MVTNLFKLIKNAIYQWRVQRQIAKANKLAKLTGYRYYVIMLKGKPQIYAKQDLKLMIATHKFKKGFKIADLDRIAIHKTF